MIEPYKGPILTAEFATNYINPLPINYLCKSIQEEIEKLNSINQKIIEAKSYCSKEFLDVEGIQMEERLELNSTHLNKYIEILEEYLESVKETLKTVINEKQILLNEKAIIQERQIIQNNLMI